MKKLYQENRVMIILMSIVAICVIIIAAVLLKHFFGGKGNAYEYRLDDGTEKVEISAARKSEIESKLTTNALITKAKVTVSPTKTIYIEMTFTDKASLDEAKSQAVTILESFTEKEKGAYDFEFTLTQEKTAKNDGFNIWGSKNINGNFSWGNNNINANETSSEK